MPANGRFSNLVAVEKQPHDPRTAAVKYDPEYCMMIRDMAQDGLFPESWCARIGVTMRTLFNWANTYPDFEEAMHIAWHILHAVWSERAMKAKNGFGEHPPSVLLEILRKRFPATYGASPRNTHETFTNRNTVSEEVEGSEAPQSLRSMSDEDLRAQIETLKARLEME